MYEKVQDVVNRYEELNTLLSSPDIGRTPHLIREYSVEQSGIAEVVATYRRYLELTGEMDDAQMLLDEETDDDMSAMISEELTLLQEALEPVEEKLKLLIVPKDPRDERDVIVEIRAGAGGDEAGLFAGDLFRMYSVYAGNMGWKTEIMNSNETGIGGYKEIIFEVKGKGAYSKLKFESGVHRVQRVPVTESSGRIHTSTATVAVLPQVDDVDVEVLDSDLRIDVYRASGKGGQGVNTTDSAVRITHLPTGIVAQCQDERSQLQNKLRAMTILRARLYDLEYNRQMSEIEASRRQQVGTGERSEKIRTYNFPQSRVTDHRIHLTLYKLEGVLAGNLDVLVEPLAERDQAERLAAQGG